MGYSCSTVYVYRGIIGRRHHVSWFNHPEHFQILSVRLSLKVVHLVRPLHIKGLEGVQNPIHLKGALNPKP